MRTWTWALAKEQATCTPFPKKILEKNWKQDGKEPEKFPVD
jgi:hypothetical protein